MHSKKLDNFKSNEMARTAFRYVIGGDDSTSLPTPIGATKDDGVIPKATPVSSSTTHIRPGDEDDTKNDGLLLLIP